MQRERLLKRGKYVKYQNYCKNENIILKRKIYIVKKKLLQWRRCNYRENDEWVWWSAKKKKSESNALSLSPEAKLKTKVFLIFLNPVKEISNKIWGIKLIIVPIVFGELETIPKCLLKSHEVLEIQGIFINVPKADKLKIVCILKSAQDKRKDFLSLDLW